MKAGDILTAVMKLNSMALALEDEYIETGGEVTEETKGIEQHIETIKELLTTEGVDSLGRWLKAKQDEIATAKAEKAAATARLKALENTEAYIKDVITKVLLATNTEKVRGTYYTFTQARSVRTSVDQDELNEAWLEKAQEGARKNGLPDWVDVVLKTTATQLQEEGGDALEFLVEDDRPAVRFTKPRAVKE